METLSATPVTKTMTTREVADRLCQLLKENKMDEIYDELFSEDALNVEPAHANTGKTITGGRENIRKKSKEFDQMIEAFHSHSFGEPQVAGNVFSMYGAIDITMKGSGRTFMEEITVYEVKDGKIVREQFFY